MPVRNRLIKAEFWSDEELAELPRDLRLFFIGLWSYADDWGRLEERPQKIRVALFPYDDDISGAMVTAWLDRLTAMGKLIRYEADGRRYIFVRRFLHHQDMRRRKASVLPAPPETDGEAPPPSPHIDEAPTSADVASECPKVSDIDRLTETGTETGTETDRETPSVDRDLSKIVSLVAVAPVAGATRPPPDSDRAIQDFQALPRLPADQVPHVPGKVRRWQQRYPELDIGDEVRRYDSWLLGKPREKASFRQFENWLKKAEDDRLTPRSTQRTWQRTGTDSGGAGHRGEIRPRSGALAGEDGGREIVRQLDALRRGEL